MKWAKHSLTPLALSHAKQGTTGFYLVTTKEAMKKVNGQISAACSKFHAVVERKQFTVINEESGKLNWLLVVTVLQEGREQYKRGRPNG